VKLSQSPPSLSFLPKPVWALAALYFIASLAHFAHNAEYIAYYPNMPASVTRETVYLVWLAITGVGAAGIALARLGWQATGALCLAVYGALGLDGLAHYTLALCSEHTAVMNATIWSEAVAGVALAVCSAAFVRGRLLARPERLSCAGQTPRPQATGADGSRMPSPTPSQRAAAYSEDLRQSKHA
jgi:hypothetical protein